MLNAATFVCWKYVRMESKTVAVTFAQSSRLPSQCGMALPPTVSVLVWPDLEHCRGLYSVHALYIFNTDYGGEIP